MYQILKEAHEARLVRLQSRWSRITVTHPDNLPLAPAPLLPATAASASAHIAAASSSSAASAPSAPSSTLAKDEDGCAPLSTAGVLSFSLFGEERVGETIGSLIWEGCAALMVHLLTRSCDDPAVTDAVVPSAGASSSVPASRSSPVVPFRSCLAGKRVLELGAGIGVLGCLAAQLGAAHVCITDRKEILHVIQHNITANQLEQKAECRELQWGTAPTPLEGAPFDFIIASDVIYNLQASWLLLETLVQLTDEHTVILIAYRERTPAERAWFVRASEWFDIVPEAMHARWADAITFTTLAEPPPPFTPHDEHERALAALAVPAMQTARTPTASHTAPSAPRLHASAASQQQQAPVTATVKFKNESRPLSILRLRRKKSASTPSANTYQ